MTQWSPQQDEALIDVNRWIKDASSPQVYYLAGFAGTGKTTLARHLAEGVEGQVLFAAFTGKAALVMRSKGCEGASTIHSLIYSSESDPETGIVTWRLNSGSAVADAALVIVDECSMVGEKLICLKNKRAMGLLNGGMWEVHKIKPKNGLAVMDVIPLDDDNKTPVTVSVHPLFFEGREQEIEPFERRMIEEFTHGHAITCHKAQGSAWPNVMIFDESAAFRDDRQKWLYTSVTSSSERLTLVM